MEENIKKLIELYKEKKEDILTRTNSFHTIWIEKDNDKIYRELVFCLLTPQSKAQTCWKAVQELDKSDLIFNGCQEDISNILNIVRFKNNKARYIVNLRNTFYEDGKISIYEFLSKFSNPFEMREWLVQNIIGLGYKESSHFLRNIGLGQSLSILDRHILRNLVFFKVIESIPKTLLKNTYLDIEKKMSIFAEEIKIPLEDLGILLLFKENGEIFK